MNPKRRRRHTYRRNDPAPAHRRRRHHKRRRRVVRHTVIMRRNSPARRAQLRGGVLPGLPPADQLLPPIAVGVGSAMVVGWGVPYAASYMGWQPVGIGYRLLQAGVAFGGAIVLGGTRLVSRASAVAFATVGTAIAALGFVSDWQRGLIGPTAMAPAGAPGVSGLGDDEEEYESTMGYYEPYGVGPSLGYYEAVA